MNKLNIVLLSCFVILGFTVSHSQPKGLAPHMVVLTTLYTNEIKAPFLSRAWVWKTLLAPSSFTLRDSSWSGNGTNGFTIILVDNKGKTWVHLYSDTTRPSIVQLPDDSLKHLWPNGVAFISALRRLFVDRPRDSLVGRVTFGGELMNASAKELVSTLLGVRRFAVRTWDQQNKTYINGEVLVERKNGFIVYRSVSIFVHRSEVDLKLDAVGNQVQVK